MSKFFSPNIGRTGRIVRGLLGATLILGGLFLARVQVWACVALVASGVFVLFEAARGWCVARACGIKTRF